MAASLAKKYRWFDRGAEAARLFFPRFRAANGEPFMEPFYVCPLCIRRDRDTGRYSFRVILRGAIETGELTAEHVPPETFGGREVLLTCRQCNNNAGAWLDSHARRRENPNDVFAGRPTYPLGVKITAGGHTLTATFENEDGALSMKVLKPKHQRPGAEEGFRHALQFGAEDERDITINFHRDAHSEEQARTSWLRTAYLAAFSCMGYRYILSPALERVRMQIREPKAAHIPIFMITVPGEHDWTERSFMTVREPESFKGFCARVGRHIIFLPPPWDLKFYDRLAESRDRGDMGLLLKGQGYEWPHEPSFGLPVPETVPSS